MEINQYLEVFLDESKENIQVINDQLLNLEKNPEDLSIVNEIFRAAHTLKGMSATMGYEDLADLTHKMENVFDQIRNENISVNPDMMDVMFDCVQILEEMIFDIENGGDGKKDVQEIVSLLKQIETGKVIEKEVAATVEETIEVRQENQIDINDFEITVINQAKSDGHFVYLINISLAEDCLLKAARVFMVFEVLESCGDVIKSLPTVEDLENENFDHSFSVIFVTKDSKEDIKNRILKVSEIVNVEITDYEIFKQESKVEESDTTSKENTSKKELKSSKNQTVTKIASSKTIRVNIERLDILMNLFEELVIDRGRLEQISQELDHADLKSTVERISRISSNLQNIILNMRMVPIENVFNRFPRMIRQLARELGKKIDLKIEGAETELDRTVIDEIGDPLVHLIRNALDHGLELPNERLESGKPEEGLLLLKAYHSGNHVFVEITDDGQGINKEKVLNKAINSGLISEEEASTLTDQQINELIMMSGFSTAKQVSDISGRGVGLDVVRNTIESIGGTINIYSEEGKGTTFSIQLPLTLSIISVMLVVLNEEIYAIPLSSIIETAVIKKEQILKAHNKEVIDFRGHVVPLVHLNDVFGFDQQNNDSDYYSIVIVNKGDKMAGLVVDSFIGQQEIVLKNLGNYLTNIFAISGATILGNGRVALIIDTNALIK